MKKIFPVLMMLLFSYAAMSQESAAELLKKASAKIQLKEYKEAVLLLNKAITLDSGDPELYAFRGQARHYMEDFKGALSDYNKAIELMPNYAEVYHMRGIIKGELKDNKGACEDWEKAYQFGYNKAMQMLDKFCGEETKPKK